jgi:hypothetical protein
MLVGFGIAAARATLRLRGDVCLAEAAIDVVKFVFRFDLNSEVVEPVRLSALREIAKFTRGSSSSHLA